MRFFASPYRNLPDSKYVKFDALGRRGTAVQMIGGKERYESRICYGLKSALLEGWKEITRAEASAMVGGAKP